MPRNCRSHVFVFAALGFFLFLLLLLLLLFPLVPRQFGVPPFEPQTWPAFKLFRRTFFLSLLLPAFVLIFILIMLLRFLAVEVLGRNWWDRG